MHVKLHYSISCHNTDLLYIAGTQQSLHSKSCNDLIQIWMDNHNSCYAQYICEVWNFPDASPMRCRWESSINWNMSANPSILTLSSCAWVDTYEGTSPVQTITAGSQYTWQYWNMYKEKTLLLILIHSLAHYCDQLITFWHAWQLSKQYHSVEVLYYHMLEHCAPRPLAVVNQGHHKLVVTSLYTIHM